MKRHSIYSLSLLVTAALLPVSASAAAKVSPVLLRYAFAPGQTNAYSVQIESQGDAGREVMGGTFIVSARAVGSNFIALTLRGQLRNKPQRGRMPMMGYRPGQPPTLSSYTFGMQNPERELVIDEHGRIVRQAGDQALPIPLGQLVASLIQPFPATATAGWESEDDVFVLDEPLLQGPAPAFLNPPGGFGGYMPGMHGRTGQGVLAARQKVKVKVTEVKPATVLLQKTLSLDTRMLAGAEPRVSASGEGRIEFDRALGLPKRVELDCKTVAVTENLSLRSVLSLRWQLLEGEERDKAIAPPPPVPETKFTPEEVAKLQKQLESGNTGERMMAAQQLSSDRLDKPTPELLAQMASLIDDDDTAVRRAALTVLANHGGKEQVPVLIRALNESDSTARTTVIKALGRLKDPRAIAPLVNLLASGQGDQFGGRSSRDNATVEALVHIGPAAEPAVLALLEEKHMETRIQACNILKQIGTKASLALLMNLTSNPSKDVSEAAAEASRAIQARQDSQ